MSESIGKELDEAIRNVLGSDSPFVLIYDHEGEGGARYNATMAELLRMVGATISAVPEMGLTLGTTRRRLPEPK